MTPDLAGHSLPELTTYELSARRRELERAITGIAADADRPELRRQLDEVIAEQDDRARLARA
jgi:hypothetical protein